MGRRAREQVLPPIVSGKNTVKLDSQRSVRIEQAKLYRLVMNGKLASDEATRLTYILKEIRTSLEAEPPAIMPRTVGGDIIVLSVPRGSVADMRTGLVTTPAGDPVTCEPFKPAEPTPPLELTYDPPGGRRTVDTEPLPVLGEVLEEADAAKKITPLKVPDDGKVMRLDSFKNRRDDSSGAA